MWCLLPTAMQRLAARAVFAPDSSGSGRAGSGMRTRRRFGIARNTGVERNGSGRGCRAARRGAGAISGVSIRAPGFTGSQAFSGYIPSPREFLTRSKGSSSRSSRSSRVTRRRHPGVTMYCHTPIPDTHKDGNRGNSSSRFCPGSARQLR